MSTSKQGRTIDPDDAARVELGKDLIDMDDLIEAVQFKTDHDASESDMESVALTTVYGR